MPMWKLSDTQVPTGLLGVQNQTRRPPLGLGDCLKTMYNFAWPNSPDHPYRLILQLFDLVNLPHLDPMISSLRSCTDLKPKTDFHCNYPIQIVLVIKTPKLSFNCTFYFFKLKNKNKKHWLKWGYYTFYHSLRSLLKFKYLLITYRHWILRAEWSVFSIAGLSCIITVVSCTRSRAHSSANVSFPGMRQVKIQSSIRPRFFQDNISWIGFLYSMMFTHELFGFHPERGFPNEFFKKTCHRRVVSVLQKWYWHSTCPLPHLIYSPNSINFVGCPCDINPTFYRLEISHADALSNRCVSDSPNRRWRISYQRLRPLWRGQLGTVQYWKKTRRVRPSCSNRSSGWSLPCCPQCRLDGAWSCRALASFL